MAPDTPRPASSGLDLGFTYPQLDDLQRSAEREVTSSTFTSFDTLLKEAAYCLQRVPTDVEFKRPDRAYVEGLKCDALITMLVRHRDYPYLSPAKRDELSRIVKGRDAQKPMHTAIQLAAVRNNKQREQSDTLQWGGSGRSTPTEPKFSERLSKRDDLHLSNGEDTLLKRFSALRTGDVRPPYPLNDPKPVGLPASPRPSNGFIPLSSGGGGPARPVGPRDMPSVPTGLPVVPPKVLTNGRISPFPRAPEPAYTSSRTLESPTRTTPPRINGRTASLQSNGQPPVYSTGYSRPPSRESKSIIPSKPDLPHTTSVTPKSLLSWLKLYNILVIDVRARDAFDEGHIYCKNIICVEPVRLVYGMSFDDLRDTLLYSTDAETQLFDSILDFDAVVYYDQSSTDAFLIGSPKTASSPWLRALFETLSTFNDRMPLRRPPVVLNGGLDAWTDLMGLQALQTSRTMQIPQAVNRKPTTRRPHRPSITSGTSSREVRLRRLQQYDPLNETEKASWQEQVRKQEVKPVDLRVFRAAEDTADVEDEVESPTYHRTVDDFLRRYPEAPAVPVSMVKPIEDRKPFRPAPIPSMPSIPSRPAPAASRPSYSGVSERAPNGTVQAVQSIPQQPLYRPRLIPATYKLPRTGLINYGVTCYMNSTIQCLSATIELAIFFLQDSWVQQVQKNWKGSEGILPSIFSNLIRSLWSPESSPIRPQSLRTFCGRMNPQWGMDRQQDAQEFLMFLLDCLHEDLNINWERNALTPLTEAQEIVREGLPIHRVSKLEHARYTHRESSYISDLFSGQHASRLTCLTCRKTSTSYEAFYSLSLEIPQSGHAKITDCLLNYTKEEQLEAGEEWKCPYCKKPRAATKRLSITRLPRILAISFKRFSGSLSGKTQKIHTAIDFPLFGLDLKPCMADTKYPEDENEELSTDAATTPPFRYDAYAVTRHIGNSLEGGHYIAMVRDAARNTWCRFDDDKINDFDPTRLRFEDRLQNEQAYIVFYERSRAR